MNSLRSMGCAALVILAVLSTSPRGDAADATFSQAVEVMPSQLRGAVAPPPAVANIDWSTGPAPEWIWGIPGDRKCVLRTTLPAGAKSAWLKATCDNVMRLKLNGKTIADSSEWQAPVEVNLLPYLTADQNELIAEVDNDGNVCGFLAKITLQMPDGSVQYVVSSAAWQGAADAKSARGRRSGWSPSMAKVRGEMS